MFSLKGKNAIITGGGSGIGKAIAMLFAQQGATVNIIELNQDTALEAVAEIRNKGYEAYSYCANVTDQKQIIELFEKISSIQILVNNAGIAHIGNIESTSAEAFESVYQVNVKGAYNCLYAAIPLMKSNQSSVILNIASIASSVGIADRFAYSMSKGAIHAMSMSVARDYLQYNIRSNSISPARIHTPFVDGFIQKNYPGTEEEMFEKLSKSQPVGRMGTPEEVAALALYLCSDEAGFVTGCDYPIDGGFIKLNN